MARGGKKPSREMLMELALEMTQKDIAELLNVSTASVSLWMTSYGLQKELRPKPTKEELISFYAQGMTQKDVAKKYGVHFHTVLKWQKDFGMGDKKPLRHSKRLPKKELQEMYDRGMTQKEIADKIGATSGAVSEWFAQYGIRVRPKMPDDMDYKDRDWLFREYVTNKRSMNDIAREQGVAVGAIDHWIKKFGFATRGLGEAAFAWRRNQPITTDKYFDDLMAGLLLSDGALVNSGSYSARYVHTCQYKGYLEFIRDEFKKYGVECGPIYSGESRAHFKGRDEGPLYVFHKLQSRLYSELRLLRDKWYPDGKKIVPRDIDYRSPVVWLHEYIGDGSISSTNGFPSIIFSTQGFIEDDVDFLASELCAIGVPAHTVNRGGLFAIRINKDDVNKFLEFIGPIPQEISHLYGYKWRDDISKNDWIETERPLLVAPGIVL